MAEPALAELEESEKDLEITWRAFELRPEPLEMLDPQGEYLTRVWRDHVYPLAAKINLPLKMPPLQPRSRLAHEAAKWADKQGRHADYNLALFRAFFEHGQNIGDMQVLMKLAVDLGLDPASLAEALNGRRFAGKVTEDEETAHRLGIRAVPSFVADGQILASGVQTAERLRELLERGPGIRLS